MKPEDLPAHWERLDREIRAFATQHDVPIEGDLREFLEAREYQLALYAAWGVISERLLRVRNLFWDDSQYVAGPINKEAMDR